MRPAGEPVEIILCERIPLRRTDSEEKRFSSSSSSSDYLTFDLNGSWTYNGNSSGTLRWKKDPRSRDLSGSLDASPTPIFLYDKSERRQSLLHLEGLQKNFFLETGVDELS